MNRFARVTASSLTTIFLLLAALSCGGRGVSKSKPAIEAAIDKQSAFAEFPLGRVMVRSETDAELLKKAESAELIRTKGVAQGFWDEFLSRTQGTGTPVVVAATAKLFQAIAASPQADPSVAAHAAEKASSLSKLEQIARAIASYAAAEGRAPRSLDDLVPKYIEASVLTDPWGKRYFYSSDPPPGFLLIGFTPQGKADTDLFLDQGRGATVEGGAVRRIKLFDAKVAKIVSDHKYAGALATPGEDHRLVLGTYRAVPSEAARLVGPKFTSQEERLLRFRCILRFSDFTKEWTVVAVDSGSIEPDEWFTKNVS